MSLPAAPAAEAGRPSGRRMAAGWTEWLAGNAMLVAGLAMLLVFSATAASFGTLGNAENILKQAAPILVLGLGMALVVLVGGIDLSVGSVVLAAATIAGVALESGAGPGIAAGGAILAGVLVGLANAALIEGLRISPVIVTLGMMIAVRGLALVLLARFNSSVWIRDWAFDGLAKWAVWRVPAVAIVAGLLAAGLWLALTRGLVGRRLYAAGDNPMAAWLCGARPARLRALAYVGCGACAGLGGVMFAARTGLITPSIGLGLEFFAIAVVALGAGGLPAGRVRIGQTVIGALILMAVFNYMTIKGVPGTWQTTATGLLLLAAVLVGRLVQGRSEAEAGLSEERHRDAGTAGWRAGITRSAIAAATLLLAIFFAVVNPRFATAANLVTLLEQNAALAIVAVGAMMGILSRCLDISPGSVVALGAVVAALGYQAGLPALPALLGGLLAVLAVYAANGLIVGRLGIDALIVTLAAWIWARGLAVSLTGAETLPFDPGFVDLMNAPMLFGLTIPVLLIPLAFLIGWILLARLPLGLRLYALGGDARMLRQAGVDDGWTRMAILVAMGGFTALGMIVMLGRLGAAAPTAGFGLELDAIVAVIIGGTSFRGGEGRLRDTAIGVAFLAVLNNGLSGMQMTDAGFFVVKGCVILTALVLQAGLRLLSASRRG